MKKALFALAAVASAIPSLAAAQAAAASPLTGNLAIVSDYRFRGLSQTFGLPAVQGGIDWAHPSGFYVGNWNSNVSGNQFPNGAGLEMDFYGGYKFAMGDIALDVGALYYYYPGAFFLVGTYENSLDNFELYLGAAMGPLSAKVFFAISDFFGLGRAPGAQGSSGSYYVDVAYTTEIAPRLTLGAHVGYQYVRNYTDFNYVDYKLGVTYDWTGWMLGAAFVGTNADRAFYTVANAAGTDTKFVGRSGVVLSISRAF